MSAACVGEVGELDLVRTIRRILGPPNGAIDVGPGDDAAVLDGGSGQQAWSVDRQRQGTHFEMSWLTCREIGHRAVTIAASDVWAMGAAPRWVLCAVELPAELAVSEFEELVSGLRDGAHAAGATIVGGDVGLAGDLAIVTTVGGQLDSAVKPLLRSGAGVGDEIWVVGELGWAAAGRALLADGSRTNDQHAVACIDAFRHPRTPTTFCRQAAASTAVRAMMDVSDGLGIDLHRLCEQSGVGAVVAGDALSAAVPAAVASSVGSTPAELALQGGDDYAMLCAVRPGADVAAMASGETARQVGVLTEVDRGVVLVAGGSPRPLPATGWDPFDGASR